MLNSIQHLPETSQREIPNATLSLSKDQVRNDGKPKPPRATRSYAKNPGRKSVFWNRNRKPTTRLNAAIVRPSTV